MPCRTGCGKRCQALRAIAFMLDPNPMPPAIPTEAASAKNLRSSAGLDAEAADPRIVCQQLPQQLRMLGAAVEMLVNAGGKAISAKNAAGQPVQALTDVEEALPIFRVVSVEAIEVLPRTCRVPRRRQSRFPGKTKPPKPAANVKRSNLSPGIHVSAKIRVCVQ